MSITPAFSPMPASSLPTGVSWVSSPNLRRCTLDDLYEQCSDHITEYIASSAAVGRRPRISLIRAYSSSLSPSSEYGCWTSGVAAACLTVSRTASRSTRSTAPTGLVTSNRSAAVGWAICSVTSDPRRLLLADDSLHREEESESVVGRPGQRVDGV